MAKKPTIPTFTGSISTTQLNTAFTNIKTAFDNTISIDGSTPNAMNADLDLNENDLLNAKDINFSGGLYKDGVDIAASLGSTSPAYFNQADYMHNDDLELIRAGVGTGQDVTRVTNGLRLMFEEAVSYMLSANGAVAIVVLEPGVSLLNRSVTSATMLNTLWSTTGRGSSRITITAKGPVAWTLSGWLDGHSAVRTDGIYGDLALAYPVPMCVFEWSQKTGLQYLSRIDADITISGELNQLTDPVGFRFYRLNATRTTGALTAIGLRNSGFSIESCFNTVFDTLESRAGSGWQYAEHGKSGIISASLRYSNTGATVQILNKDTLVPEIFFEDHHVGKLIALDRQGISQIDSENTESGRRGAKWFTITAVDTLDRSKCTVSPTPDFTTGSGTQMQLNNCTFSFAAIRATTTANSASVTLSAPVVDSMIGKTVTIVGAGYQDGSQYDPNLTSTVIAHSGSSITLAHKALTSLTNAPMVGNPQFQVGTMGPAYLHSSYVTNDDFHIRRMWCENGTFGVVPMVIQDATSFTIENESKLHGAGTSQNNFGGNFANIVGGNVKARFHGAFTHSAHSPYFGKFIFAGKRIGVKFEGNVSEWTADTNTSMFYLDVDNSINDFQIHSGLIDTNRTFPNIAGGQVPERGRGDWSLASGFVKSIGSKDLAMSYPQSDFGVTKATAYGSARASAVDAIASGLWTPTNGVTYLIENSFYIGVTGSTSISDLPGLEAVSVPPSSIPQTVASLPTASRAGAGSRLFVSDATATTFASVVTGGGVNNVPVYSDGTNWRIG